MCLSRRNGYNVVGALVLIASVWLALTQQVSAQEREVAQPDPSAGMIEGVVSYDGPLPDPVPIFEAGSERRLIEIDPETHGLKDAVVWVEGIPEPAEGDASTPLKPVLVDQREYRFVPHVLTVTSGQEVEFLNSDLANHGVTASSPSERNRFNVHTPAGGSYTHRFEASRQPVAIGCPIHASMAAWIFVFDHPVHAVTDDRGAFRLPPVPAGRYRLRVQHPSGGMRHQERVVVTSGEPTRIRVEFHENDRDSRVQSP